MERGVKLFEKIEDARKKLEAILGACVFVSIKASCYFLLLCVNDTVSRGYCRNFEEERQKGGENIFWRLRKMARV